MLLECICIAGGELRVNGYGYDTGGHQLVMLLLGQLVIVLLRILLAGCSSCSSSSAG